MNWKMVAGRIGMTASRWSGDQFQDTRAREGRDTVTQFAEKFRRIALQAGGVSGEIDDGPVGFEQSRRAVQRFELTALDVHFDQMRGGQSAGLPELIEREGLDAQSSTGCKRGHLGRRTFGELRPTARGVHRSGNDGAIREAIQLDMAAQKFKISLERLEAVDVTGGGARGGKERVDSGVGAEVIDDAFAADFIAERGDLFGFECSQPAAMTAGADNPFEALEWPARNPHNGAARDEAQRDAHDSPEKRVR